jgi:hypothetical protein
MTTNRKFCITISLNPGQDMTPQEYWAYLTGTLIEDVTDLCNVELPSHHMREFDAEVSMVFTLDVDDDMAEQLLASDYPDSYGEAIWEMTDTDEHDRTVHRTYLEEARQLENIGKLGFMDMCHALGFAREAMRERINTMEREMNELVPGGTIHAFGALTEEGLEKYRGLDLYVKRLKLSHERLCELALQRGVVSEDADVLGIEDMYATRQVDIWIRG